MAKIAFIGAHNDDAEIFSGGTLLKHIENGDKVYLIIKDSLPTDRKQEQIISDKISGFSSIYFNNKDDLEKIFIDVMPDIIITHRSKDTHIDHKVVNETVFAAMKYIKIKYKKPDKIYYCNTHNGFGEDGEFSPDIYIDVSKYIKIKRKLIMCFSSQKPEYRNKKAEAITSRYGIRCDKKHVEAYKKVNYLGFLNCEDLL